MIIRSLVLFIHVVGMLVLFIGIAFEWLSLESLRRATTSEHASSSVRLYEVLPRVYGVAFAVLLLSGIYLARGVGLFDFAWVRLSLGLMVLMGILGGPAVRWHVRAIREEIPMSDALTWRRRLLTGLCWFIALQLLLFAPFKFSPVGFFGYPSYPEKFVAWGYPAWFSFIVGGWEIFAAVMLVQPRRRFLGAAVLLFILTGAIATHIINRDSLPDSIAAPVILCWRRS